MYDSREKGYLDWQSSIVDAREEGLEIGLEKGREKGREGGVLIGRLLALQEILAETLATEEEIKQWPINKLSEAILTLQTKLRDRKA